MHGFCCIGKAYYIILLLNENGAKNMSQLKWNSKLFVFLMIIIFFSFNGETFSQNYNPPFPRTGQLYFYSLGTGYDMWKNHDLVAIRHYMGSSAKKVRDNNPDVILLGATAGIVGTDMVNLMKEEFPEEWFVHYTNGDKIPLWGDHIMNITADCPKVDFIYGNQNFNEFLAQFMIEYTDWNYFDGLYWDGWILALMWMGLKMDELDFNNDGIADGSSTAEWKWQKGNEKLINNIRAIRNIPILCHNAPQKFYLNGNAYEFWTQSGNPINGRAWNMTVALEMLDNCVAPRFNYANGENVGTTAIFRADFTSAQIVGAFFGNDEGVFAHRFTYLHDEYEGYLGYPTSSPRMLETGVWSRYFDNGVLISNISGSPKVFTADMVTGGPYYRIRGNQDPVFNNGQIFDGNNPIVFEEFDGIMLLKQPTTLVTPIVIDNVKNNATTIGQGAVRYSGSWDKSKSASGAYGLRIGWDVTYAWLHYYSAPGNGSNTALYRPEINISGEYEIFEWHGSLGSGMNAASNVPYEIKHKNGVSSGTINQTSGTARWNSLGTYQLEAGSTPYVKISNNANGYVISDAIKFVCKASEPYVPPANDDNIPPNTPRNFGMESNTETSITLKWDPPLAASDGDVALYYKLSRDGQDLGILFGTSYSDGDLEYKTSYNYELYSFDDGGNPCNTPASGTFSTFGDEEPPEIASVQTLSLNTIEVAYNEPVNPTTAEDINNYSISNGITISMVTLNSDQKTVKLNTNTHTTGGTYTVTINNIKDLAPDQNVMLPNSNKSYIAVDNLLIFISADNEYELYVNGDKIGDGRDWWVAEAYVVPLVFEKYVIAVKGIDVGAEAALVVLIEVGGKVFKSDTNWKVTNTFQADWQAIDYIDTSWPKAVSYGVYGSPEAIPWANTPNGGIAKGMATDKGVEWIWTDDFENDNEAYFRYVIAFSDMTPPNPPVGVKVTIP